jgi:hypothetical protein
MTVRQLIEELQAIPEDQKDLPVTYDGDGCSREVRSVEYTEEAPYGVSYMESGEKYTDHPTVFIS